MIQLPSASTKFKVQMAGIVILALLAIASLFFELYKSDQLAQVYATELAHAKATLAVYEPSGEPGVGATSTATEAPPTGTLTIGQADVTHWARLTQDATMMTPRVWFCSTANATSQECFTPTKDPFAFIVAETATPRATFTPTPTATPTDTLTPSEPTAASTIFVIPQATTPVYAGEVLLKTAYQVEDGLGTGGATVNIKVQIEFTYSGTATQLLVKSEQMPEDQQVVKVIRDDHGIIKATLMFTTSCGGTLTTDLDFFTGEKQVSSASIYIGGVDCHAGP